MGIYFNGEKMVVLEFGITSAALIAVTASIVEFNFSRCKY